jgi:tetratricopeptide (TPR) repeat protein
MRHPHDKRAHGWWQGVVFSLSLVVAFFVYIQWPEPDESVQGYTPAGCHEQAKEFFRRAHGKLGVRSRCELYASSVKYIEALEERFGVKPARWDAYEMLGDAYRELTAAAESEREIARQLRLKAPAVARAEALRGYRAAAALIETDSPDRPRLLRKTTEMLLALDRPAEALEILRGLMKLYRRDKVDLLRRERGEEVGRLGGRDVAPGDVVGRGDEALRVYFLAGRAAIAVAKELESKSGFASDADAHAEADASRREAGRAFAVFLDSGGAGERRAAAETALGDLAFAQAAASPRRSERLLAEAAGHYRAAGTPEAEFLRARALYAMGQSEKSLRIFRRSRDDMTGAERRARRYMEGWCLLALGRIDDSEDERGGKIEGARSVFAGIRSDERNDADGVASLVGLAEIARGEDDLERVAEYLLEAATLSGRARGGMALPERDRELEGPRLAGRLVSLAEAFESDGEIGRAVEVYRRTLRLDPGRREALLYRIARAWERKAGIDEAAGELPAAMSVRRNAADDYVKLAGVLLNRRAMREALAAAASLYAAGGSRARAIEVARRVVREWPDDPAAPRMLHVLATWEAELGLTDKALEHFDENVSRHWSDVHADKSLMAFVELLEERGGDDDLAKARDVLRRVLDKDARLRGRYVDGTLVRLQALFALGRVDVRLADRADTAAMKSGRKEFLSEAMKALNEALAGGADKFPATGKGARPRFHALVTRERQGAMLLRERAVRGLSALEGSDDSLAELGEMTADARWNSVRASLENLRGKKGSTDGGAD